MRLPKEPPGARYFCDVVEAARRYKLLGYWEGSAYRDHPCGVIRGQLILASHWSTHSYCHASVMTQPEEGLKPWCNDSWAYGDPYPHPKKGGEIKIYWSGRWQFAEGPWQDETWKILMDLENEIADESHRLEWNRRILNIEMERRRQAEIEMAIKTFERNRRNA